MAEVRKGRRPAKGRDFSRRTAVVLLLVLAAVGLVCLVTDLWGFWHRRRKPVRELAEGEVMMLTTGYCNCEKCCSWTTNELGQAVFAYGKMKGRVKIIGQTSKGTMARRGTVAADLSRFPYGTRLRIPGYGDGVVEDIGGKIRGNHIDLWFPTHEEALRWGCRRIPVRVL